MYHPIQMGCEHYLNADFDLSLRRRWRPPAGDTIALHRIRDFRWHALYLAEAGDSVVVPEPAPGDFLQYLEAAGVPAPTLIVEPAYREDQVLAPFGWNADAAERNRRYRKAIDHPALETVKRVNSRSYSAELEEKHFGGGHILAHIGSEDELRRRLVALPETRAGWVVKAEHGNAALGNRRLRGRELKGGDLTVVRQLLEEDDLVVIESWRRRIRDLCATFRVTGDGSTRGFHVHETVNTADGALIGALFAEDPTPLDEWHEDLSTAASAVANELAGDGYTGPVAMDAFVWDDNGESRLRPLVDLNARREMSAGASNLWRRMGGRGAAYWRFFTRRKFDFPQTYQDFVRTLGDDAFDPRGGRGALVTAPLWLGPGRRQPAKAAMLLLGADRTEVFGIDARIRERFEK
jgi:hypothetical protein